MRDWSQTLFPASFKGVPFWVRSDGGLTGRRLAPTAFPGSDRWQVEDMGAMPTVFEISGYLIGDVSDMQTSALEAVCGAEGVGPLVLPAQGPVNARCFTIKRRRERDQAGRFAFEARFILETAGSFAMPADFLAQQAFDAVAGLASAAADFVNRVTL